MDVQIADPAAPSFSAPALAIGFIQPPPPLPPLTSEAPALTASFDQDAQPASPAPFSAATADTRDLPRPENALSRGSHLSEAAGKLFHAPRALSVEFHATNHPNEIVTILRDPATGQVYAEFPADAVVRLAEFFQHLAGFVVDQKA